jgi:hypothetical protein
MISGLNNRLRAAKTILAVQASQHFEFSCCKISKRYVSSGISIAGFCVGTARKTIHFQKGVPENFTNA